MTAFLSQKGLRASMSLIHTRTEIDFVNEVDLNEMFDDLIAEGMENLRNEVEKSWKLKAEKHLDTSLKSYEDALIVRVDGEVIEATLTGWLPVSVEEGHGPFDLKPFLLQGRNKRVIYLADGEFRTVSKDSPPDSWWHPGIQAQSINMQIEAELPEMMERAFSHIFERVEI